MFNTTITLSNGVVVPQLALGTWLIDNDKAADKMSHECFCRRFHDVCVESDK